MIRATYAGLRLALSGALELFQAGYRLQRQLDRARAFSKAPKRHSPIKAKD